MITRSCEKGIAATSNAELGLVPGGRKGCQHPLRNSKSFLFCDYARMLITPSRKIPVESRYYSGERAPGNAIAGQSLEVLKGVKGAFTRKPPGPQNSTTSNSRRDSA
jgi:hypothetical protein